MFQYDDLLDDPNSWQRSDSPEHCELADCSRAFGEHEDCIERAADLDGSFGAERLSVEDECKLRVASCADLLTLRNDVSKPSCAALKAGVEFPLNVEYMDYNAAIEELAEDDINTMMKTVGSKIIEILQTPIQAQKQ
eukprot:TRINITY_DN9086_c0_g1_i6.p1 TRINITY_DN9086_c0_g1~~TRINITY_DN9086_c0_g1_i6.p1  ORF type:complete len:137 (+),score=18.18 TRINITY_DN9086_c0_g1_i6:236-646(+)